MTFMSEQYDGKLGFPVFRDIPKFPNFITNHRRMGKKRTEIRKKIHKIDENSRNYSANNVKIVLNNDKNYRKLSEKMIKMD